MATVQQIAKRTLRLIGVSQTGEEPSAGEAEDLTHSLNDMLYMWEHDGISLSHSTLNYTDTFPYPDNHINPVVYNLAIMVAPEYGKNIPGEIAVIAQSGRRALKNYYLEVSTLTTDSVLNPYYNRSGQL